MRRHALPALWSLLLVLLAGPQALAQNVKVVVAEASYVMGDSDTLAGAEENALLRAKRKAVEEAGVYIEALSQDVETYAGGKSSHLNLLGVRTLSAAVTETEILDKRRSLEGDRIAFHIKIRATILLDKLEEAVKRLKSDEQLAEHHRQLQSENTTLKSELGRLRKQLRESPKSRDDRAQAVRNRRTATDLVRMTVQTRTLPEKIELASKAIAADDLYVDAYIVRGQTYLRIASLAFANKKKRTELNGYVEQALSDFERGLALNPSSEWALLGRGDALTWQRRMEDAAQDYERILELDPLFDIARQRLIILYTTSARQQTSARQWRPALATLDKVLGAETPQSWVAHQKEAYLLRSQVHLELGEVERAIEDLNTVIRVDPTTTQAFLQRAKLYRRLMQGRMARDDFERACSLGSAEACAALQ